MVIHKSSSEFQFREKVQKYEDYIRALEEERKKIQVFERELPLCLELVSEAIERCRQQITMRINESFEGKSDNDQTSSEYPVLEEFIPIKSTSYSNGDVDDQLQQKQQSSHKTNIICSKDWLASAQLSIQASDPHLEENIKTSIGLSSETDGGGCGGHGHHGGGTGQDKVQSNKKERRCWSQELHRRFLHALQQLGGAHVATPKQIRESMKVDGLTNDEIKSHLQKYRLHTRKLSHTVNNMHTQQLVVVGRLWMPPLDYTTDDTTSLQTDDFKDTKALYAPITSLPLYKTKQCKQ